MITYLYLKLGDGRATLAIDYNDAIINVGATFCSPEDRFVKAIGRELAANRLETKTGFYLSFNRMPDVSIKGQIKKLFTHIVSNRWGSITDFDTELEMQVNTLIIENIVEGYDKEIEVPITVHTDVIPQWARRAVNENTLY